MVWSLIFLGIVLVPNLRGDDSACTKLKSWNIEGDDPIEKAVEASKVSVVMFTKAGCPSSRSQVMEVTKWFEGLDGDKRSASTLSLVNKIGDDLNTHRLTDVIKDTYPIYQDTDKLNIWKSWKGMKDCIYVIDHCGKKLKKMHRWNKGKAMEIFEKAHKKREANEKCKDC